MRKPAVTSVEIHPVLAERWSPRAFDATALVKADDLTAILEAGRWAPSAFNGQPWRYLVAERGDAKFEVISQTLSGFNQEWAPSASAYIVACALTVNAEGNPIRSALFDLGLSVGSILVEAHHRGYHIHQMAGFDRDALKSAFNLVAELQPVVVLALGVAADAQVLGNDILKEREAAPRERKALSEILL